jgi:hypothetical protein
MNVLGLINQLIIIETLRLTAISQMNVISAYILNHGKTHMLLLASMWMIY